MLYQPRRLLRLTLWSGQDKRLSIPTNIWLYQVTKAGRNIRKAALLYQGTFLGRAYESPAVCTALTENKQFATKSTSGPFHIEIDTTLEAVDGGTQVTSFYRGESRGFFKVAEPILVRLTRKHFETAAENLRTLLEDQAI